MAEFQEFPKMLYHKKKGHRTVKDAKEEAALTKQGFTTQAPKQFEDEEDASDEGNMPDQNDDPTREPAIVSQLEQEKTRLAGNMGAKDPAELQRESENDSSEEDAGDDDAAAENAAVLAGKAGPIKKSGGKK